MLSIRYRYSKASFWSALATTAGLLCLVGCQSRTTGPLPPAQVKLGFQLQSADLASLVNVVTLTMTYPDTVITDTLPLVDGEIHDTLVVTPADSIVFTLRAYNTRGNSDVLLYIGSVTRGVSPGQQVDVNILLLPNPELLMLRVGPLFQSVLLENEGLVSVYVDVANVDSLFGASFRIHYDTRVLGFSYAEEGDFLRGSPPVETISVFKDTLGYVACAVSRLRQETHSVPGVSGSGRLAKLFFTKRAAGSTAVTIDPEIISLTRPGLRGFPVNRFTSLVRESATVEVR